MVPGEGPQPALGMIVGEAPGHDEVRLGRPFVGKSGGELDGVLKALGVDRSEVYITNVVKEIPLDQAGQIRRPTSAEVKAWVPILFEEWKHVAPQAILCLGRTASDAMIEVPGVPVGSRVGICYTAWHPSFVARGFGARNEWLEQIRPWVLAIEPVSVEGHRW